MNHLKESDYMSKPTDSLTREFLIAQVLEEKLVELDREFDEAIKEKKESSLIFQRLQILREVKIEALKRLSKQRLPY